MPTTGCFSLHIVLRDLHEIVRFRSLFSLFRHSDETCRFDRKNRLCVSCILKIYNYRVEHNFDFRSAILVSPGLRFDRVIVEKKFVVGPPLSKIPREEGEQSTVLSSSDDASDISQSSRSSPESDGGTFGHTRRDIIALNIDRRLSATASRAPEIERKMRQNPSRSLTHSLACFLSLSPLGLFADSSAPRSVCPPTPAALIIGSAKLKPL